MEEVENVALQEALTQAQAQIENLTAERDSLVEENTQMRDTIAALEAETAETKKLNYTLARQLDTKPRATLEANLISLYGKGKN